ncbi:hypothetical protein JOS77_30880 [Chromobacterium haemolyticum]|nr:hypothetical protein JOS77_30880 [Chromobacterium haemolyticum]
MISHNTQLRDYLITARQARSNELVTKVRSAPDSPELRRRRDDAWERRIARELAGNDPITDKAA